MIPIFIGYDAREAIAFHVCVSSIIRNSSEPVTIMPLALANLNGCYRENHADGSNAFSYSRFLVPSLAEYAGWAIYLDGDMILRTNVSTLWSLRDNRRAAMVVKHDYRTRLREKYLGAPNEDYPRKNWSSVILWNCGHAANRMLTADFVSRSAGSLLHRFSWLEDELIGELPVVWNWLPDEYGPNEQANLLHWTLGTPCFEEFANAPMADEWRRERIRALYFGDQPPY